MEPTLEEQTVEKPTPAVTSQADKRHADAEESASSAPATSATRAPRVATKDGSAGISKDERSDSPPNHLASVIKDTIGEGETVLKDSFSIGPEEQTDLEALALAVKDCPTVAIRYTTNTTVFAWHEYTRRRSTIGKNSSSRSICAKHLRQNAPGSTQ